MEPNFSSLKPVENQPNFSNLKPVNSTTVQQTPSGGDTTDDGFLSSLVKDPIKTLLVKPAIRTAQAAAAVAGAISGNDALQNNANVGQTFDVPILGKYYIEGQKKFGEGGATQIAGDALKTASYLAPTGPAEGAVGSLLKGQLLKAAGKGAVTGGIFGALGAAGNSLQQEEPTFGKVLEDTLIGGGLGAASGGILGVGGAYASKGIRGLINSGGVELLKNKLGIQTAEKTADNLYSKLADTNSGILNLTKNQINSETRYAKDTPLFIAKEAPDVSWNVTKEGRLDTQPIIDALEPKYHAEAQAFNTALKDSGQYGSIDKLQSDATAAAKEQFKGTAQEQAIAKIDAEALAYKKQYASDIINHNGDTLVPIHIIDDIKSDLWSKTKFYGTPEAALGSQTSYLMGNSAKNQIENIVTDSPIKEWNKRLGDFASAIKILNQRNGIQVGAGAYSKTGARLLGGIAGHTIGGIPGEIAGMVTADQLLKMASDPNVKSFVLKKLIQKMEQNGQKGIIEDVQKVMAERAADRLSRRALPSPAIPMSGLADVSGTNIAAASRNAVDLNQQAANNTLKLEAPSAIPMGQHVPVSTVQSVPAKAISVKNPKTGRFERAYTSEAKIVPRK